jgi:membrane protease YdiL (CAAX protease family)
MFVQVALLIVIVLFWERRPLASFGVRPPRLIDLRWGLVAFVIIRAGDVFFWSPAALPPIVAERAQAQLASWPSQSEPLKIVLAALASLFEESYFRGYMIERMEETTGSMAIGVILGTAIDSYLHLAYWDTSLIPYFAFSEISLALVYLWRRSVVPCVIAHFLMDVR